MLNKNTLIFFSFIFLCASQNSNSMNDNKINKENPELEKLCKKTDELLKETSENKPEKKSYQPYDGPPLDGDDWFENESESTIEHLNNTYKNPALWLTYGQFNKTQNLNQNTNNLQKK